MGGWGHGVPGGGDACKQVVVALGLCMGHPGVRHRGQSLGPSKKGRASFAPAEVKASQETMAGARVMTGLARGGEDSEWWAQGGHPSLATHRRFKEGSARPPVGDIPPSHLAASACSPCTYIKSHFLQDILPDLWPR